MGLFDFLGGGGDSGGGVRTSSTQNKWIQAPDYPEAAGARANWWDTLQQWQDQPGYGAIAPNWDDIWKNASEKVQRYYMGGPEGPGAAGTVRANLARRGVSEQPAAETAISRLGMHQGNVLSDMAVQQAIQKAAFGESGRQTWLSSLMNLAGLKPQFLNAGSNSISTYDPEYDQASSALGGVVGNSLSGGVMDMIGDLFNTSPTSDGGDSTGLFGGPGQNPDGSWNGLIHASGAGDPNYQDTGIGDIQDDGDNNDGGSIWDNVGQYADLASQIIGLFSNNNGGGDDLPANAQITYG